MGAPGRLFGMPVPWLCHRPALQASRQYPDGLGECICLYLEPVHALLHRGRAGRAVPEGMPELAIAKVDSLLRLATEPVYDGHYGLIVPADVPR